MVVIAVVLAVLARVVSWRLGIVHDRLPGLVSIRDGLSSGMIMVAACVIGIGYLAFVVNPIRRRLRARSGIEADFRLPTAIPLRLLSVLTVGLVMALFTDGFAAFKRVIPLIKPFSWDPQFQALDRLVHLGVDPWRISHAIAGSDLMIAVFDWVYFSWFFVGPACLVWAAWSLDREWRLKFFTSHMLVWIILGIVMATSLSSVGPAFYGRLIDGVDPFEPLMDRLRTSADSFQIISLRAQDALWKNYVLDQRSLVKGISAMPSVHIGACVLLWLSFRDLWPWLGRLLGVYALLIFVSTVHLAWHYAIDGYVAAIFTWGIWRASGPAVRWYLRFWNPVGLPPRPNDDEPRVSGM